MGRGHVLETSLIVHRSRREVFRFFAEPGNLDAITPPDLRFEILTPSPIGMRAGALIEYRLRLAGFRFGWLTWIEVFAPEERFVDVQVRGPYRRWRHTHVFEEVPQGTLVRDRVEYELPLGAAGELAHQLFVRSRLRRIFSYRAGRISELLDPPSAPSAALAGGEGP
jgi:ligand-binding SRPBCC domain-containing protein